MSKSFEKQPRWHLSLQTSILHYESHMKKWVAKAGPSGWCLIVNSDLHFVLHRDFLIFVLVLLSPASLFFYIMATVRLSQRTLNMRFCSTLMGTTTFKGKGILTLPRRWMLSRNTSNSSTRFAPPESSGKSERESLYVLICNLYIFYSLN